MTTQRRFDPDDEVGPTRPVRPGEPLPVVCGSCTGSGWVSDPNTIERTGDDGRAVYRKVRCAACRGSGVKGWTVAR